MKEKATAKFSERQMDVAKNGVTFLFFMICLGVKGVQVFLATHFVRNIQRNYQIVVACVNTNGFSPNSGHPKQDGTEKKILIVETGMRTLSSGIK